MEANIKKREDKVRRQLAMQGFELKKSRAKTYTADNQGGYMIVLNGIIEAGERFGLSIEDVERFTKEDS